MFDTCSYMWDALSHTLNEKGPNLRLRSPISGGVQADESFARRCDTDSVV